MRKRGLALLLCLVICISTAFIGCGSNADKDAGSSTAGTAATAANPAETTNFEGLTLPLTTNGETLKITTPECFASNRSFAEGNFPIYTEGEKATGVNLEWEVIKPDYDTVIKTRLASGSDLPDIMTINAGPLISNYIDGKLFTPLSSLIDESAPNIKKFFEARPDIKKMVTYTDKEIYMLPNDSNGLEAGKSSDDYINPTCLIIRNDMLKKLNMAAPQTIEDFYKYFKGVKELGMIPYVTNPGEGTKEYKIFASLYGFKIAGEGGGRIVDGLYEDNGTVKSAFYDPKFKELLTEMNKWYSEKLFKIEKAQDEYNSDIISGKAGAYHFNIGGIMAYIGQLKTNVPDAELAPVKVADASVGYFLGYTVITKDCKNPKLALQWLDYTFFTDKGMKDQIFGAEGVSYAIKDGVPAFTDDFKNVLHTKGFDDLYATGAYSGMLPHVYKRDYRLIAYKTFFEGNDAIIDQAPWFGENCYGLLPKMLTTNEELDTINKYVPDLSTYINEMTSKFITGQESLSNYDAFLKKLDSLNIQKVIEVQQKQLDRFNSK